MGLLERYHTEMMIVYLIIAFWIKPPERENPGPLDYVSRYMKYIILFVLIRKLFFLQNEREKEANLTPGMQNEFKTAGDILSAEGRLIEPGWSRKPIRKFDISRIGNLKFGSKLFNVLRIKQFEYYSFLAQNTLVQIGVGNVGYGASMFVNIFDYETKRFENYAQTMFPVIDRHLYPQLSPNPFEAQEVRYTFAKGGYTLNVHQYKDPSSREARSVIDLRVGTAITGEITSVRNLAQEDHFEASETDDDSRYFYYNLKSYDNKWSGKLNIRGQEVDLGKQQALGMSDFGRGVFPYHTNWIWASGYGRLSDGRSFGLNFGGGISFLPRSVEDYFKIDGKIHKLHPVRIRSTFDEKAKEIVLASRKEEDKKSRANVIFTPLGNARIGDNLVVIVSDFQYVYGTFSGTVTDQEGTIIEFKDVQGMIEWGKFKW